MKKVFALIAFVAIVVTFTACKNGPKIEGTPIDKPQFTLIQPAGWEIVANEDDNVEIKKEGEKFKNFITVKTSTEAYDKAMEYYLREDGGGYKQVSEIEAIGAKLNVLQKPDETNFYFLIAPQGKNVGSTIKISLSTNETKGDPLANEEVKAIIESLTIK